MVSLWRHFLFITSLVVNCSPLVSCIVYHGNTSANKQVIFLVNVFGPGMITATKMGQSIQRLFLSKSSDINSKKNNTIFTKQYLASKSLQLFMLWPSYLLEAKFGNQTFQHGIKQLSRIF